MGIQAYKSGSIPSILYSLGNCIKCHKNGTKISGLLLQFSIIFF